MIYKHILLTITIMLLMCGTTSAWLSGYDHRMQIDINNTGDNLTYYQYNFTNNTATLVSASKMNADGSDCRITNATDVLQEFWNGTEFNTSSTKIWVNATSLGNVTNTTHYLYYGNSGANSVINGKTTFTKFDDFEPITTTVSWGKAADVKVHNGWYEPQQPLGIHTSSQSKTFLTWINYTYTAGCEIYMIVYNHTSGEFEDETLVVTYPENDGHGSPAIAINDSGYIYNFYGSHSQVQKYKISSNPYDVTSWGSEQTTTGSTTYPHPFCIDNIIYTTERVGSVPDTDLQIYNMSSASWTKLVDFGNTDATSSGYHRTCVDVNNATHIACVKGHNDPQNLYYIKNDDITNNSAWENASGLTLTLPAGESDTKIYTGGRTWIYEMCADELGNPCILFSTAADDTLKFMRHNGTAWNTYNVTDYDDGDWHSYGAMIVDNSTHMRICLANNTIDTTDLWKTTDSGETWTIDKVIGEDIESTYKVDSFQAVLNANSELEFMFGPNTIAAVWGEGKDWSHNEYTSQTIFTTDNGVIDYTNTVHKFGGAYSAFFDSATLNRPYCSVSSTHSDDNIGMVRVYVDSFTATEQNLFLHGDSTHAIYPKISSDGSLMHYDGGWIDSGFDFATDTWYLVEIENLDWTSHKYDLVVDGVTKLNQVNMHSTATYNDKITMMGAAADGDGDMWIDNFIIRQYAATEPTSSLGAEENAPCNDIVLAANKYGLLRKNVTAAETFSTVAGGFSHDVCFTWWDDVTDTWLSYWVGDSYNSAKSVPQNDSYFVLMDGTGETVSCSVASAGTVAIPVGWSTTYLRESTSKTLTAIKSDMGGSATDLYAWNHTALGTGAWTDTGAYSVLPNQGLLVNASTGFNWDGAVP